MAPEPRGKRLWASKRAGYARYSVFEVGQAAAFPINFFALRSDTVWFLAKLGIWQPFLYLLLFKKNCLNAKNQTVMKSPILNTPVVSAPDINVASNVKALTEQVNNLQSRYSALASDCEVRTISDRWYFRAIGFTSFGLIFFPLLLVAAYCVYRAKKCQKGDNNHE